jgi:YgiT-type zinc finger domain-containing protein
MNCNVCKHTMLKRRGDVEFWYDGKLCLLKNIEHYYCENCGERIYSQESTSKILRKFKKNSVTKYKRIPVYA